MNHFSLCILTVTFLSVSAKPVQIDCPKNCKCDKYETLKRVRCVNRNLLNIADIPKSAEILDVSNNQIMELKDHEFIDMNLSSLKLLNLSHNKISDMKMHTFQYLDNIKTIDLSHNIIQYVHSEWFYDSPSLKELYLNNNDFAALPNDLIESKSLEVLDISYCRISHVKEDTFSKLPNLRSLNLEGNFLIELNVNTISYLQNLQLLNVKRNSLHCNGNVAKDLINYLNKNEVGFQNPCLNPKASNEEKFQRMIKLDDPVDEKNAWIFDDEPKDTRNQTVIYNCTIRKNQVENDALLQIIKLSPILSIAITFTVGLIFGLILACSIEIKPSDTKTKPTKKRYSVRRSRMQLIEQDFPLVSNGENLYESTPIPQRRFEFHQL